MIGISKLYGGSVEASDPLRYGRHSHALPSHLLQFSADKKPVVVWNCTRRCNLACSHCYSASDARPDPDELSDETARAMIDDLAAFGCPVLLFSGGEPLLRPNVIDLLTYARRAGLRTVLSTNGCLIDPPLARRLAEAQLGYVGISLDGASPEANDAFRGRDGAFDEALAGIDAGQAAGLKVGLRFTIHRRNADQIDAMFDLLTDRAIPRICFYHLVSAGRGQALTDHMLSAQQSRSALDRILARTRQLADADAPPEVLTVANHADGPYLYLRLLAENPRRAEEVYRLLEFNGGNGSGVSIGCIDWRGRVHPDQFWRSHVVGDIRRRPFSEIWTDPDQPLLAALRNRRDHLACRCQHCRFLDVCNGNLRARAEAAGLGTWGDDPGCYLTDDEIQPPAEP
jgi:Fe-coproporphyrin III synthase